MVHANHEKVIILILQGKFGRATFNCSFGKSIANFSCLAKKLAVTLEREEVREKTSEVTKTRASSNCN